MANTFKNAATGSSTDIVPLYTCPGGTSAVVHAIYLSNVDGTNDATIDLYVTDTSAGSDFYIMKTVDVPADSTLVIEKPINLEAGDVLKAVASANGKYVNPTKRLDIEHTKKAGRKI